MVTHSVDDDAEESGCWMFPPFLCQPFISCSVGGVGGLREAASSFICWQPTKNILYWAVWVEERLQLCSCLTVHLPPVGIRVYQRCSL